MTAWLVGAPLSGSRSSIPPMLTYTRTRRSARTDNFPSDQFARVQCWIRKEEPHGGSRAISVTVVSSGVGPGCWRVMLVKFGEFGGKVRGVGETVEG